MLDDLRQLDRAYTEHYQAKSKLKYYKERTLEVYQSLHTVLLHLLKDPAYIDSASLVRLHPDVHLNKKFEQAILGWESLNHQSLWPIIKAYIEKHPSKDIYHISVNDIIEHLTEANLNSAKTQHDVMQFFDFVRNNQAIHELQKYIALDLICHHLYSISHIKEQINTLHHQVYSLNLHLDNRECDTINMSVINTHFIDLLYFSFANDWRQSITKQEILPINHHILSVQSVTCIFENYLNYMLAAAKSICYDHRVAWQQKLLPCLTNDGEDINSHKCQEDKQKLDNVIDNCHAIFPFKTIADNIIVDKVKAAFYEVMPIDASTLHDTILAQALSLSNGAVQSIA